MQRLSLFLGLFIVMMATSSSAQAGSYSFSVGGHRIHIEAPRNCRSSACVAITSSGLPERRREVPETVEAAPAPPPAPVAAPPPPACAAPPPTPPKPAPAIIAAAPAPTPPPALAAATAAPVPPPAPLRPEPVRVEPPKAAPVDLPRVEKISVVTGPQARPPIRPASSNASEDPAEPMLGQWESEGGKGTVRIEHCGGALCGYAAGDASSKGESVLVNMKPKSAGVWTGSIFSRASGNTYFARMTLTDRNKLRVEACAIGHYFCTGNEWTRIEEPPVLTTSRQWGARS